MKITVEALGERREIKEGLYVVWRTEEVPVITGRVTHTCKWGVFRIGEKENKTIDSGVLHFRARSGEEAQMRSLTYLTGRVKDLLSGIKRAVRNLPNSVWFLADHPVIVDHLERNKPYDMALRSWRKEDGSLMEYHTFWDKVLINEAVSCVNFNVVPVTSGMEDVQGYGIVFENELQEVCDLDGL